MIKVSVLGATGYVGGELLRILNKHPDVKINSVCSQSYNGKKYADVFSNFRHDEALVCVNTDISNLAQSSDVIFLCMPHGVAANIVNRDILKSTKIIDLGADFRLKDSTVYKQWYGVTHNASDLLKDAVYGLCEINRLKIKEARLIANPGCYTTCSILSLYPLIKEKIIDSQSIIIDAKSGVSGAGRGLSIDIHYTECNESIKAYKIASHRHTPEIEEQLSVHEKISLVFTPHLVPMNRGILSTAYAKPVRKTNYQEIKDIYNEYYKKEFFIRLTNENVFPETRWVKGSNFCDIGFKIDERTSTLIIVSALDNLVKGAAGQAVQNMNILFGINEQTALCDIPIFP